MKNKLKIKLIFRKLNKNLEKVLENFRLLLLNYFSFYTFLKTQLPHCQTQAYDCGRGKTRLGGQRPRLGGQLPPLAPCWLRPWLTVSSKVCDLVISTNIYIHLDIAQGSIFQGNPSDIIYLFPNNIPFGHLINFNIRQKREHLLVKKYFSDMTVYFTHQNNNAIDFMQSVVTLTFEIKQV